MAPASCRGAVDEAVEPRQAVSCELDWTTRHKINQRRTRAQDLLAFISGDFSGADVEELRSVTERLASDRQWHREPPRFVDQFDAGSRTRPGDEAVRTVGLLVSVSAPGEHPPTSVDEPTRVVDALAEFSEARGVEFELQLDDTYVGEIRGGVPDRLVREGLLARWS